MSNLPKILTSKAIIRFQDCDPFNHLNNSKYIDYLMNAREDQILKNYQLDIFDYARKKGKSWVVKSNQIAYLKPAFLMESVTIESQLMHYNEKELSVELRMWDNNQTHLKALLWSTFSHFDIKAQESTIHEEELLKLFDSIMLPIESKSFEKRVLEYKPTHNIR